MNIGVFCKGFVNGGRRLIMSNSIKKCEQSVNSEKGAPRPGRRARFVNKSILFCKHFMNGFFDKILCANRTKEKARFRALTFIVFIICVPSDNGFTDGDPRQFLDFDFIINIIVKVKK